MGELQKAVETVVGRCLGVQPGERFVVVADTETLALGQAMHREGLARGAEATLVTMEPRAVHGQEPPADVAEAMRTSDVFVAPTLKSLSHTEARKAATEAGARGATLPGVTEDMLARLMSCDFETLQRRSRGLAALLTEAGSAQLTCPRGTDMRFDLRGRTGLADDGDLVAGNRAFGNLPCGEGFIAPAGGEGRIVPRTIAGIGLVTCPVGLLVEDGRMTVAQGPQGEEMLAMLRAAGELGTNLAELGIGTNEKARLTGNVLEDEKILGTAHVAFGASASIGGTVSVPVHLDVVVVEATLDIGGTRVLDHGRFVFEG
jgi:leucyl aminopeptidase (aminopeptidase T)